jgi:hypothetical protein
LWFFSIIQAQKRKKQAHFAKILGENQNCCVQYTTKPDFMVQLTEIKRRKERLLSGQAQPAGNGSQHVAASS